ncbi:hypothetical protein P7C70_g2788, partial [Phenoliferia sp. Uapishka_3]
MGKAKAECAAKLSGRVTRSQLQPWKPPEYHVDPEPPSEDPREQVGAQNADLLFVSLQRAPAGADTEEERVLWAAHTSVTPLLRWTASIYSFWLPLGRVLIDKEVPPADHLADVTASVNKFRGSSKYPSLRSSGPSAGEHLLKTRLGIAKSLTLFLQTFTTQRPTTMSLKPTAINSTLFPKKTNKHVEEAGAPAMRDLGDGPEDETMRRAAELEAQGKIILVDWAEDDPDNPLNWPKWKKWLMTDLLCLMTLFIGLATSGYSVGISEMCKEFGVNNEVGEVGMFVFNAAFAIVPLVLAPMSDYVGRNPVYLISYAGFTLWFIGLALGKNIWSMIIFRFFSGCFGAAGTTMTGGTLSDMWATHERSTPMAIFSFVAILGTILAPVYCGFILQAKGWRWLEWVQLIVNGALVIVEFAFLRETRGPVLLARRAKKLRKDTNDDRYRAPSELELESYGAVLRESCGKAVKMMWQEPVVLFFSIWISFAWGVMFLFFTLIPLTFAGNHGWNTGVSGLGYLGLVVGTFIGFGGNFYQDYLYNQATIKNGGIEVPEARLYSAFIGAFLFPLGLYIFSFTQYRHVSFENEAYCDVILTLSSSQVHWIGPEIALVLTIIGIYCIFLATYNYLADSYGQNSASAISAQGFMRNAFAAAFPRNSHSPNLSGAVADFRFFLSPVFGTYMFKGMHGYQYTGLFLSLLASLAIPFPFILFKYGPKIRENSKYAREEFERQAASVRKMQAKRGEKVAGVPGTESEDSHEQVPPHPKVEGENNA